MPTGNTVTTKDGPSTPIKTAWGSDTIALPDGDTSVIGWPGLEVKVALEAPTELPHSLEQGAEVGKIVITAGDQHREVALRSQEKLRPADFSWRLTRLPSLPFIP